MRVPTLAFAAAIAASLPGWADSSTMDLLTGSDAVKWGPGPSGLPKGAMIAVISGDPSKDGPSVVQLKLPANYQIPAHHHSKTENITVLSGSFHAGMGDKLDVKKGRGAAAWRLHDIAGGHEPLCLDKRGNGGASARGWPRRYRLCQPGGRSEEDPLTI